MAALAAIDLSETSGVVDLVLCSLIIGYCIGLTIVSYRFVKNRFAVFDRPYIQNRFGSLFLNVNKYDKKAVYFTFYFLLRRIFFAATIALFNFSIVFQVLITDTLSTLLLAFYISVRPFQGTLNNLIEIVNEVALLESIQLMFIFTDWTENPEQRYAFGYYLMYFIGSVLGLNLLAAVFTLIAEVILSGRRWWARRARKAKISAIEERRIQMNVTKMIEVASASAPDLTRMGDNSINDLGFDIVREPHRNKIVNQSDVIAFDADNGG